MMVMMMTAITMAMKAWAGSFAAPRGNSQDPGAGASIKL